MALLFFVFKVTDLKSGFGNIKERRKSVKRKKKKRDGKDEEGWKRAEIPV